MTFRTLLTRFLVWRIKHVGDRNFVLFLGAIVGSIAGFAAVTLKVTVHFIQETLNDTMQTDLSSYLYIVYPLVGILITVAVAWFSFREQLGHGITHILYVISKKSSILSRTKMYSRMITSAITVGFGGSAGLEAPIVVTGSAIGSNIGRLVHVDAKKRTLLIACGAAGAIAGIFNSPIAGVIFALEVLLTEVAISTFMPVLIASVFGSLVSHALHGDNTLFSFELTDPFLARDVPFYIVLGVVCGLVSVYFTRVMYKVESWVQKVKGKFSRAIVGGILLGLIVFVFPPIYGEGYDTITTLLEGGEIEMINTGLAFGWVEGYGVLFIFLLGVILIKPIATALTIGSGGSGGIFAPSLFLGGITGFVFAKAAGNIFTSFPLSTSNFTLIGMCGVMSGVLHAPLTAIFLIAEITSGYTLFIPLMLVSAIAYSSASYFEHNSLYAKHLVEQGDLIQNDKDRQVLSLINLSKIIERDLLTISPDATLGELVERVRQSKRNIFPVVNAEEELEGIVTLDDVREIMFDEESRNTILVKELMHTPPANVAPLENMQSVMHKFEITGAWNLPVIDNGKYIGFISKSRIFNTYRTNLKRQHKL